MGLTAPTPSLSGWTPIRLGWHGRRPEVDWCLTEGVPFTEPFFTQTIETCLRHPARLLFRRRTGLDEVGAFVAEHPGLSPAGFLFHMSRCGSTLVAQMLAASSRHLVLSEPGPLDQVLRSGTVRPDVSDDERAAWLRWMVGALGQRRDGRQERLFVKLDAWSVLDLALVRRAFPDVPWLFLYRDPVEVLASHAAQLGAHLIPGVLPPERLGMTAADVASAPPVEYQARVLARICEAALGHADDPGGTLVEYGQLPGFVVTDLPVACSTPVDREEQDRMLHVATKHAKNPALAFSDDRDRKQAAASPALRAAAERWLAPLHERLQAARASQEERHAAVRR